MIIKSIILGIVQGATEFLPVSSSAHLVIMQDLLNTNWNALDAASFDVALHLGTALAVIVVLREDIKNILGDLFVKKVKPDEESGRSIFWYIVLGTIPAVIVALSFKSTIEELFISPKFSGVTLLVTGLILLATKFVPNLKGSFRKIGFWQAILVGCAQAIAIIPGISRSGSTISAGLFLKWDPKFAARFSFLLSLPAIIGASILALPHISSASFSLLSVFVGFLSSFIVGFICIKWMLSIVSKSKLWLFSPYCLLVGALVLILL